MTVARARDNGIPVDDQIARKQLTTIGTYIESWRERVLQGQGDSRTFRHHQLYSARNGRRECPARSRH